MRRPPPLDQLEREVGFARSLARGLLSDEHLAEDVVQQTWLTFLERPPPDARRLGAWFHTVSRNLALKGLRGSTRRRRREAVAARPEAEPAAAEVVERSALLRAVADAVAALDEPYRRTMMQRYYEALPPRRIAAREGVPVATVRSRIQRAHAQLRARLDGRFHDRRAAFGAALVGLAEGRTTPPSAPPRGGEWSPARAGAVRLESLTHATWWLAPALLLATVFVVPRLFMGDGPEDASIDLAARPAVRAEPPPLAGGLDRAGTAPAAAAPGRPADAPAWIALDDRAVRVEVRRALDGTLVPGVTVSASSSAHWVRSMGAAPSPADPAQDDAGGIAAAVSGEDGVAWIAGLPIGGILLEGDRGGRTGIEIVGPGIVSATLELPLGVTVRGEVVDADGRPRAGAAVWCSGEGPDDPGSEVARADEDGRFRVVDLPPDRRIAARAEGAAPSEVRLLGAPAGAELDEVLLELGRAGGRIRGRVVSPDGFPCPDAEVRIERLDARIPLAPTGPDAPANPPFVGRTDAAGAFASDVLSRGLHELLVRADGAAPHRRTIDVQPDSPPLLVELEAGASVEGIVTDAAGEPFEGAVLSVASAPGGEGASVRSAPDGSFLLQGLLAGPVTLRAEAPSGSTTTELVLVAGGRERVDPTLPRGRALRGRVIAERGEPAAGLAVVLEASEGRSPAPTRTGEDGRFEVEGCAPLPHRVSVFAPHALLPVALGEVDLSREAEVLLRIAPPAEAIAGRITSPGGAPLVAEVRALLVPWRPEGERLAAGTRSAVDGAFVLHDLPPGPYLLEARAPGFGTVELGVHELEPGRTLQLGSVALRTPGRLLLDASDGEDGVAFVRSPDGRWAAVPLEAGRATFERTPGEFEAVLAGGVPWRGTLPEGAVLRVPLSRAGR